MTGWDESATGVLRVPSGRLVRGRGLARPMPGGPSPDFALYLLGEPPEPTPWESRWVRWPDFRLPAEPTDAADALKTAWRRYVRRFRTP
jgi:hypothetical protein